MLRVQSSFGGGSDPVDSGFGRVGWSMGNQAEVWTDDLRKHAFVGFDGASRGA